MWLERRFKMATLSTDELQRRFRKALEGLGGAYDVEDIVDRVKSGQLQHWQRGQSVVVTEVLGFPRKKVVNILIAAGNLDEIMSLQEEVSDWARKLGCSRMIMAGRKGWNKVLPDYGWTNGRCIYELDLESGA